MIAGNDLPASWIRCRLGDVVDYGSTQKVEPDAIPTDSWLLELEDLEKHTSKVLRRVSFAQRESRSTKNRFVAGDVLYGKLRPYLNKVVRADQDGYCSTEIVPLKPSADLDGGYLFFWLKSPAFLEYVTAVSHGINMPRLGTEAGGAAPFVLAPINEQKRIADKLDAVLVRVDACCERLDRVAEILKRFREAVLTAATSGELTRGWVGHAAFTVMPLSAVAEWSSGGTPSRSNPTYFGGAVPWVKTGELRENLILETEESLTESGIQNSSARVLPLDTVLVAMYGATIGRVAMLGIEAATNQACAAAETRPEVARPRYLFYLLQAQKGALVRKGQGGAQPNISQGLIRDHEVQVPRLPEQDEITRRIEALLARSDRIEAECTTARKQIERLTPAVLAKAFRGELVPQDPNDELASVLLDRLRTARAADVPSGLRHPSARAELRAGRTRKAAVS